MKFHRVGRLNFQYWPSKAFLLRTFVKILGGNEEASHEYIPGGSFLGCENSRRGGRT